MGGNEEIEPKPVHVRLTPLFEARWSYEDFARVLPFGPDSEGQAYAYSQPSRVDGERLSGSYRLVQFPRVMADGALLPDVHGFIEIVSGDRVATRASGYGLPVPGLAIGTSVTGCVFGPRRKSSRGSTPRWLSELEPLSMTRHARESGLQAASATSRVGSLPAGGAVGTTQPICETGFTRWTRPRRSLDQRDRSSRGMVVLPLSLRTKPTASSTKWSNRQLS